MKKMRYLFIILLLPFSGCELLKQVDMNQVITTVAQPALTNDDIIKGLKEALNVGTQNAIKVLSADGGFLNNPLLKIPFPPEVQNVEQKLRSIGAGKLIDDFVLQMNKGAEKAVVKAGPIFVNAITSMTITDAYNILHGQDNAATEYFKSKTTAQLFSVFKPEVQKTLDEVMVTKYWNDITTKYNSIPLTKPIETDLAKYVTNKALDGLFSKLTQEEKNIRLNPAARTTEILKKVFGSLNQ